MLNVQHDYKYKEIYNQDECRLCLYQTLFELCLSKNLRVAPPFSISINIFDNAKFDHSIEVCFLISCIYLSDGFFLFNFY